MNNIIMAEAMDRDIYELLKCPLTGKIVKQPIIGPDGIVYDLDAAVEKGMIESERFYRILQLKNFLEEIEKNGEPNDELYDDLLKCPVTLTYFTDPVVAQDGHIYECRAIMSCVAANGKSPMTREKMTKKYYQIPMINRIIEIIGKKRPQILEDRLEFDNKYINNALEVNAYVKSSDDFAVLKFTDYQLFEKIRADCDCGSCDDPYFYKILLRSSLAGGTIIHVFKNSTDFKTDDLLFECVIKNRKEVELYKYLLDNGYDFNRLGFNPLICAIDSKNMTAIEFITNNWDNISGSDLMKILRYNCNVSIIKRFIDKNINIDVIDDDGYSLVFRCMMTNNAQLVDYVLAKIPNWEPSDVDKKSLNMLISKCGEPFIMKSFLKHEIDMKHKNRNGLMPIHNACRYSNYDVAKLVIDKTDDLENCLTSDGWNLLHSVCRFSRFKIINYILLDKGMAKLANEILKNYRGETVNYHCVHLVEMNGNLSRDEAEHIANILFSQMG